ncbi:MAG: hypothetical protein Q4D14_00065 [Bacteroidales bacterium]|nr:hypothetical protein [Bacteroidales bacterium]
MEKEFLTQLISRDLNDLRKLVDGFIQLTDVPEPLVRLAAEKADDLATMLRRLSEQSSDDVLVSQPETVLTPDSTGESTVSVPEQQAEDVCESHFESEPETSEATQYQEEMLQNTDEIPVIKSESVMTQPENDVQEVIDKQPIESERRVLFAEQEDRSLGTAFLRSPVVDLKKAISLADRFRFIRELFDGNGEQMSIVVDEINQLHSFDEFENYLATHFPQWNKEDAVVIDFINIVSRKF